MTKGNYYQIEASINVYDAKGYVATYTLPTFHLDRNIHGLLNEAAAEKFAKGFLSSLGCQDIIIHSVIRTE